MRSRWRSVGCERCSDPGSPSSPSTPTTAAGGARVALAASGHSRAPVCLQGDLDQVLGIVHLRDLLADDDVPVRDVVSPVEVAPESAGVLPTLRDMQQRHCQLLIVVNEHGGVEGIVTVEDLLEELVGEIYDETDRDIQAVRHSDDGSLAIPGAFPIHDLVDLGIDVPSGDYATLAGFVLAELQRIPDRAGDVVTVEGWRLTVSGVHRHAITEVLATPIALSSPDPNPDLRP